MVNNTDVVRSGSVMAMSEDDFDRVIDIILEGVRLVSNAVAVRLASDTTKGQVLYP